MGEGWCEVIIECNIPFNLQKVLNSWLTSERPFSLIIKSCIPSTENVHLKQLITADEVTLAVGCILRRNRKWFKHFSAEETSKINMKSDLGDPYFFPRMYWCFCWHHLVYFARFTRFSHFDFTVFVWPA